MKLTKHFDAFLKNKVNLSDARIEKLDARVGAVGGFLETGSDVIAENFIELLPQGSYAQRTIINPVVASDEYDADVLLDMDQVEGWKAEDYVGELYKVFRASSTYHDMVRRRSRCVALDYAGDFHMDVVPFLTRHDQRFITNRKENAYELTNPEGFNEWLDKQNRLTSGRLVKTLRLLKFVRDYKNNFSIKSVILTILIGGRISDVALLANPDRYKDFPTTFLNLLEDLNDYLQLNQIMPSIDDPSCPSEDFNHRWDQDQYSNFRNWIKTYAEWARDAYDETDATQSYVKWRKLLGDDFGIYEVGQKVSEAHRSRAGVTDTEEQVEDKFPVMLNPAYRVKLRARTVRRNGWRTYDLAQRGNQVEKNRNVTFTIAYSNVPEPYAIWWKVRNTGSEAITRNMIRGQIVEDGGNRMRTEPTSFRGNHYVEIYVAKNGVVVARDHQSVIVK